MATVYNFGNDSIEKMYRIFKKQIEKSGLFADLRKKEFFEKPSIAKKKKHKAAIKRQKKEKYEQQRGKGE